MPSRHCELCITFRVKKYHFIDVLQGTRDDSALLSIFSYKQNAICTYRMVKDNLQFTLEVLRFSGIEKHIVSSK